MLTAGIIVTVLFYGALAGVLGYYLAVYKLDRAFEVRQDLLREQVRKEADAEWEKLLPQVREEVRQQTAAEWQKEVAAARAEEREAVNKEWSERVADLLDEARAEVERDWQKRVAAIREEARLAVERERPIRTVVLETRAAPAHGAGTTLAVPEAGASWRGGPDTADRLRSEIEEQKERFARMAEKRRRAWEEAERAADSARPGAVAPSIPTGPAGGPASAAVGDTEVAPSTEAETGPIPFTKAGLPAAAQQPGPEDGGPAASPAGPARGSAHPWRPGETLIEQLVRKHLHESASPPAR